MKYGSEYFSVDDFNPDGTIRRGPVVRPKVTYRELEMTEEQQRLTPKTPQEGKEGYELGMWDRVGAWIAKPDDMLATAFKEALEIRENFQAGLARSGYDWFVTANNVSEYVADKLNLPYEAKKNFLAASAKKLQNMNIQPTSEEWEDQLAYLAAMLFPDALLILTGGGIAGAGIKYGLKAATMSNRTATIASVFGRLAGDTAVGSLQMMAHEAGQAELEGRVPDYAQAGKDGAVMSIALSSIGRSMAGMGFKRRYSAVATGATMDGITRVYADPNDPHYNDTIIANRILGVMFGLMTPGTHRVGGAEILKWVKARHSRGLKATPKSFLEEFAPHTYENVFVEEVARDRFEFEPNVGPPRKLSPRDLFMDQLADITKKDIHGLKDDQVIHVVMEHLNDMQLSEFKGPDGTRMSGIDSITNIQDAKIMMEAVSTADALFKLEYPKYKTRWEQPDTPIRYKDRVNIEVFKPKKGAKPTSTVALERRSSKKVETNETIVHKRLKTKELDIHELSWIEYKKLFGDTPGNRIKHKEAIEAAALSHTKNKKTWPNKGALIEYDMQNDWGYIWRKPLRLVDRPEPVGAAESAHKMRTEWDDSIVRLSEAYYTAKGEYREGVLKQMYKLLVDPAGDLFHLLETAPDGVLIPVRQALELRYGKATRTQQRIDEVAERVGWDDMSKDQHRDIDVALWNRAKLDDALRHGTDPPKPVEERLGLRHEDRRDGLDLIEGQQEERPGGIKVFEDRIRAVEDVFSENLDLMVENDLIPRKTYNELKKFKHIPFRTVDKAFRAMQFNEKGLTTTKAGPSITESPLKNLLAKQTEEVMIMDSELLVNRSIAIVENLIADNAVHTEMAKTQGKSGGLWYTPGNEPPKRIGGIFERKYVTNKYLVDGEVKPIKIDEMLAKTINSIDQERVIKGWAANALRLISGTQFVQLSAVALNPIFGIVTHPLDVGMIFSGHAKFGSGKSNKFNLVKGSVPHLFTQFYIKQGLDPASGWLPFVKNLKAAWNKDQVFKDWVKSGGVEQTLVSHFQHVEGIKRATDIHNSNPLSSRGRRANRDFFKTLEWIGKFGHVMEVATRMTEAEMLVKAGLTPKAAAHESLRRLNYGMQGKAMQFFGTLIPFANAQAQILAHVGRSWTRSPESIRQAALVTGQLIGITMYSRYLMEEHFPKYMEDISWETRRRYFIIPTGATTVVNGVSENVYFKIKKAYSPVYTILEGVADMWMDRSFGYKEMPASTFQRMYESAEVAMPLDLRSIMPPIIKVWMAANGTTVDGRKIYKGRPGNLADEINREGQKGIPTENWAILAGQVTDLSPARMQEMVDSVIADNPILWWTSTLMPAPKPEVQRSILAMAVKSSPLRKVVGTSNNSWRNAELGIAARKEAGSYMIKNVDDKVNGPILRLWSQDSSIAEFSKEMALLQREASRMDQPKFGQIRNQTIDSFRYVNRLLKSPHISGMTQQEYEYELYGELDPKGFWPYLRSLDHAPTRAKHYEDRYNDTDDDWKFHFKKLAMLSGFFNNAYFVKELRILERLRRKEQ